MPQGSIEKLTSSSSSILVTSAVSVTLAPPSTLVAPTAAKLLTEEEREAQREAEQVNPHDTSSSSIRVSLLIYILGAIRRRDAKAPGTRQGLAGGKGCCKTD